MTDSADAREARRLAAMAHHFTYGDGADPAAGAALAAEALVYATLALAPAQALPVEAAPVTIYRAEHPDSGITLGHYGTAAAARAHCEAMARREIPGASLDWIEDEEDGTAELAAAFGEDERATGYVVTALELASEYDEEADE
ncbi:hypothetical protein [Streptomyces sp. MNP-20]|uniref:hypothetical protein n=1 Tax=Streptomyces sp. MNP-20 TaxID=2721165 RepID=UPI001552426C|nr:hypothetical protein [Streptomyces sp. MNP-20]